MNAALISRRALLGAAVAAGGVVLLPRALATGALDSRPRLVVLIARGGMDGLSLTPPLRDPHYAGLRTPAADLIRASLPLDSDFGLHPSLTTLGRHAAEARLRLAPAAALWLPDRSHFRAQNLLETGDVSAGLDSGWLGRAAERVLPGGSFAIGIGSAPPLMLQSRRGPANWSVDQPAASGFVLDALDQLYSGDPELASAAQSLRRMGAIAEVTSANAPASALDGDPAVRASQIAARFLAPAEGASMAVLSFFGFDTHTAQGGVQGKLAGAFAVLDRGVHALETGLGPAWAHTVVVIVTEFGRTAAFNGLGGADHGTAASALVTGGAVKAGALLGDWPGLAPSALFEGRDLRPTLDLRALLKGVLADHFGADAAILAREVFPDSAGVAPLRGLA